MDDDGRSRDEQRHDQLGESFHPPCVRFCDGDGLGEVRLSSSETLYEVAIRRLEVSAQ